MDEQGVTRSVHLSSSLHFSSLADYRAAGSGQPVLPGQSVLDVDNGYGLQGNPTLHQLQDAVSELEDGSHTLLFPSGLTALTALIALLDAGDHWILPDNVYGPMRRFAEYAHEHYDISCDYYDPRNIASAGPLIKPTTKLIHIETPGSVTFDVTDVDKLTKLAKTAGIVTSADNTWASGVLYKPLSHDVDISILSLTKYAAGYSDVFVGSLTTKDSSLFKQFAYYHRVLGCTVSPFSAMLVNRGLESLEVRLAAHGDHATQLVQAIAGHKKITKVYQAGPRKSDGFAGPNSLFSIELDREYNDAELEKAFATLKTFKIGESWGGTRSLVLPFQPGEFSMRTAQPQHTIIRFHAGLEKIELQLADITKFLKALN